MIQYAQIVALWSNRPIREQLQW